MLRAWLSLAILMLAMASHLAQAEVVARIALTVGESRRMDASGHTELLRLGTVLSEGDRITTGKDSIAIIVFSDEGRVSLRADSELLIRRYRVDPSGAETQLQFDLVRGAVRQISGQAARLQPERYRLNTPIAAIGVRGTDFFAKISSEAMETFVQEGMIVVLPNLAGCSTSVPTGGCNVPVAAVSASDAGQYLRMAPTGKIERRSVGSEELERLFGISLAKNPAGADGASPNGSGGSRANTSRAGEGGAVGMAGDAWVNPALVAGNEQKVVVPPVQPGIVSVTPSPPVVVEVASVTPLPPVPVDPVVVVSPPQPVPVELPKQLVWGRFTNAEKVPLQLPVAFEVASAGRHVTVAEFGNPDSGSLLGAQYGLWRAGSPEGLLSTGLRGQVQFSMAAGEAFFQQGSQNSIAQIQNASFGVDFDRSRFDANLTLSHAQTGAVGLNVSGNVNDQGVFSGGSSSQRVAGALSLDGKEAGFLFSRTVDLGVFRGVTLWNTR